MPRDILDELWLRDHTDMYLGSVVVQAATLRALRSQVEQLTRERDGWKYAADQRADRLAAIEAIEGMEMQDAIAYIRSAKAAEAEASRLRELVGEMGLMLEELSVRVGGGEQYERVAAFIAEAKEATK